MGRCRSSPKQRRTIRHVLNLAVAFESNSGDLLATYAESGTKDDLRYRTWSSGGGWSGELKTADKFGDALNSMTLSADPFSNHIMLAFKTTAAI